MFHLTSKTREGFGGGGGGGGVGEGVGEGGGCWINRTQAYTRAIYVYAAG